jgi:hypothetical protein
MRSTAQRGYLWANHPDVARKFEAETPADAKLPDHVKRKPKYASSPETIAAKVFSRNK